MGKFLKLTFINGDTLGIFLGNGHSFYKYDDATLIQCGQERLFSGIKETPEEILVMLASPDAMEKRIESTEKRLDDIDKWIGHRITGL